MGSFRNVHVYVFYDLKKKKKMVSFSQINRLLPVPNFSFLSPQPCAASSQTWVHPLISLFLYTSPLRRCRTTLPPLLTQLWYDLWRWVIGGATQTPCPRRCGLYRPAQCINPRWTACVKGANDSYNKLCTYLQVSANFSVTWCFQNTPQNEQT